MSKNVNTPMLEWDQLRDTDCKILVGLSGGKDSIATCEWFLRNGIAPERIHLHHHLIDGITTPLNGWDWPVTEAYCKAYADLRGIKLFFSAREGGITREIYRMNEGLQDIMYQEVPGGEFHRKHSRFAANKIRYKFPAIQQNLSKRWCSSTVKIDVMDRIIPLLYKNETIIVATGERREESAGRAKYLRWERHRTHTKSRIAYHFRPIIDFIESEVWTMLKYGNIQPHPAYMIGWSRCSCATCIFSSKDHWSTLNVICPEKIDAIEEIENRTSHMLHHGKSIREVVASGNNFFNKGNYMNMYWKDQLLSENWYSGIETKPGLWQLPVGAFLGGESCGAG